MSAAGSACLQFEREKGQLAVACLRLVETVVSVARRTGLGACRTQRVALNALMSDGLRHLNTHQKQY